jgi:hypothetical protein
MSENLENVLAREEAKRGRAWDPAQRWKAILGAIAWAEEQRSVRRNDPALRVREERAKLRAFGK